ncbi:MAG TPA: hypothetical protein DEF35_08375 [Paenibacillus sp.]|uniref:DUF6933 domain-containing protein n=1 Tax=Paenibacillus TaxID=44249 RepID=UPI000B9FB089|nr:MULTISPECIES: hypothetical protein [Paenibacillus]OZQ67067.1 hypothetical protein CA599_17815 [Paenibacillus taichungensis]HBU81638.1 hypothetical protein [Paenibacillus sp.]
MKGTRFMIIFKATKDTLKDLNVKPEIIEQPADAFFSWHVNFFKLYGKKHYVFMNDFSRLSLTVTGIRTNQANKLKEVFVNHLQDYFAVEQIPEALANSYIKECSEEVITKTDSRSVIGTMNEMMLILNTIQHENDDLRDEAIRHQWTNRIIYKPIDYKDPIEVFVKELENRFKNEN